MSAEVETVQWYHRGDIARTVGEATHDVNASVEEIVDVLARRELDAPRDRIRSMVEVARENVQEPNEIDPGSSAEPRFDGPRYLDVEDAMYLDDRDLATVVGAALSRYEGGFDVPENIDDVVVDLFWNRQHTTVGINTIAASTGEPVDEEDVRTVLDGDAEPQTGRSPSSLCIVTTASFTESAVALAEANDIGLFGESYLDQWVRHARLSKRVAGSLLEESQLTSKEVDELLTELPAIPESVQGTDPLDDIDDESTSMTVDPDGVVADVDKRMPVAEEPSPGGMKGELYADPGEDGDFGAFDRYMDELDEEERE